jgi:hypothetical protein
VLLAGLAHVAPSPELPEWANRFHQDGELLSCVCDHDVVKVPKSEPKKACLSSARASADNAPKLRTIASSSTRYTTPLDRHGRSVSQRSQSVRVERKSRAQAERLGMDEATIALIWPKGHQHHHQNRTANPRRKAAQVQGLDFKQANDGGLSELSKKLDLALFPVCHFPQVIPAAASLAGTLISKSRFHVVLPRLPTILPAKVPPGLISPIIFSTLKSFGGSTAH